jgi:hypothetical protein
MSTDKRGWGPFSGGQLTTMFCVIVAAIAFPVAASGVAGSEVFVTDAASGARAAVSSKGAVSVAGAVTANDASPKNLYRSQVSVDSAGVWAPVAVPPVGKALIITSLNINTEAPAGGTTGNFAQFDLSTIDSSCNTLGSGVAVATPATPGVTSIPIPSGLVIPANRALCANTSPALYSVVMVYGYLVPASSAPAGA